MITFVTRDATNLRHPDLTFKMRAATVEKNQSSSSKAPGAGFKFRIAVYKITCMFDVSQKLMNFLNQA